MQFDRFLIAPFNTGLQTNAKPWLIMDDAFAVLKNAYVFRGRLRKRFGSFLMGGSQLTSRLRVQVGTYGAQTSPVPGNDFNIGQMFSIGSDIFTVYQNGSMLSTNANASGTFNTSNGNWSITYSSGAPGGATPVYWYPALPVMGITQYQTGDINNYPSYAFDTQFAYLYIGGSGWNRSGTALWHGNNLNFFDVCNWEGASVNAITMFVTNFNATVPNPAVSDDPIWYTSDGASWTALDATAGANGFYFLPSPPSGGVPTPQARYTGYYVKTCRLIVAFKNRLLLLNTIENNNPNGNGTAGTNTQYVNRCRFSHNGSPFAQNAWYEPNTSDSSNTGPNGSLSVADGAGYIDAATDEQIVGAEFIKDRLIVFFERSTWEIAYTGNELQPFLWQKINTELGCESQCSTVPFDKEILAIGNTGVHACNGANVARIDNKIPDEIFEIKDKNLGVQRVAGIRDYFVECVYWCFPAQNADPSFTYPNQVLLYNYINNSWAVNDDVITAFGYWEQDATTTWSNSAPLTWEEADFTWESGENQQQFRQIIAGNQEGWVFVIRPDIARNAPSLQITNMAVSVHPDLTSLTIIDHTLSTNDYILIENVTGVTGINGNIYQVISTGVNTIVIDFTLGAQTYTGGGTAARVSNYDIQSKEWNPYDKVGRNVYLAKIDFCVQNSDSGQVTVDYVPSTSDSILSSSVNDVLLSNGILETGPYALVPLEQAQARLWHQIYFQTDGFCIQIRIYMNFGQMTNPSISLADFELHGMVLSTQPVSIRIT